ncbi:hypothetical protein FQZ97_952010 [compost metagenome]
MRVIPEHPSKLARIGSCLAVMGSLVWVQWPIDFQNLNIAGVILLIASFVTRLGIELADFANDTGTKDNLLVDDVRKLNSLLKIVDRRQFYILREHAIETYMNDDAYNGLRDIIYFRQDDIFPFHNEKIQRLYVKFCEDSDAFLDDLYSLYTADGRGRMTWRTADERWVPNDVYKEVMGKIALLNQMTSNLAKSWEELIVLAKQELKGASVGIDPYGL